MERPVEVALFQRGELQSVRLLSPRAEWRAAVFAAAVAVAAVLLAMAAAALLVSATNVVVHAPMFFAAWTAAGCITAAVAARRARERARAYVVGASFEADAFAPSEVDLIRRVGGRDDYEVCLVPGMVGLVEQGRSALAVEALTRAGRVRVPLPVEGKVRIEFGPSTFVLRRRSDAPEAFAPWRARLRGSASAARPFVSLAGAGVAAAALVTVIGAAPTAQALGDADMRSSIRPDATPSEIQHAVLVAAQRQAPSLHVCFDPLPLACQRAGFVGVGLVLRADGEVRSHWVSQSTYGDECPVSACMARIVADWYFEAVPEPMMLVVPIEVKRTHRPLADPEPTVAHPDILLPPADVPVSLP